MPNKWTFKVPPLLDIVLRYKDDGETWIDPFAGMYSPAELTNDLNPKSPAQFHLEAVDFVQQMRRETVHGAIFDPPYSLTQVARSYESLGLKFKSKQDPTGGFTKVRSRLGNLLPVGGICISFGWNTVGLGKTRGFELFEVLVCCHGGKRNDTLVVVERKCR